MITISLCMIVRNEEDTLGRCLESVVTNDMPRAIWSHYGRSY